MSKRDEKHELDTFRNKLNDTIMQTIMPPEEFRTAYDQLKPTERAFVDAYVLTDDPIEAALQAFPILKELPKANEGARVRANEYVQRPMIQAAIAEKVDAIARKYELTAERVLSEVAKIAYSNIDDFIDRSTGEPIFDFSPENVTREQMAAVGELTVETYMEGKGEEAREVKRVKFKLHDKLNALDKAMKRLGLYEPEKLVLINGSAPTGPKQVRSDMTTDEAANLYASLIGDDDDE